MPSASRARAMTNPRARAAGTRAPCTKKTTLTRRSRARRGSGPRSRRPRGARDLGGGALARDAIGRRGGLAREGRAPVDELALPGLEHDQVPQALAVILASLVPVEQVGDGLGPE